MRIIETFTESKTATRPNEDAYVVLDRHVAVIDGATDKSGLRYRWQDETVSSGRFAAQVVAEAVEDLDTTFDAPSAARAVAFVSRRLDTAVRAQQPQIRDHERPTCSLVAYSSARHEVWSVGDCSWAFAGVQHRGGKKIDDLTASVRREVTQAHLDDGWTVEQIAEHDPGRAAIQSLLSYQGTFANRVHPFGYAVVNGRAVPDSLVDVHPLTGHGTLVLTSDGFPEILDGREPSDRRLFELVGEDPLCIGPLQGPKAAPTGAPVFDDRTWVSLDV